MNFQRCKLRVRLGRAIMMLCMGAVIASLPFRLDAQPYAFVTNALSLGDVSVIDVSTNTNIATVHTGYEPTGIAITPDGNRAYVTNTSLGTVSVIDVPSLAVVATITLGNQPIAVAVAPDGRRAYVTILRTVGNIPNTLAVIDTATNTVVGSLIPMGIDPSDLAVTPDSTRVYVTNFHGDNNSAVGTVWVIDAASGTVLQSIVVGSFPFGIVITPDGTRAYVANGGSENVSVIDLATNSVTATIPVPGGPSMLAITPDGRQIYATSNPSDFVSVISTSTNTVVATIPDVGLGNGVAVTPDGARAYVTNFYSNTISVIDTATNTVLGASIPVGDGPWRVAITPLPLRASVQPPINSDGSSVFNARRGSVPVKFDLSLNGSPTCQLPAATLALVRLSGTDPGPVNQNDYILPSDDGSTYRIAGCQYLYNLNSSSLGVGSYVVSVLVNGASIGSAAFGLQ